jgi:hypothetical protein
MHTPLAGKIGLHTMACGSVEALLASIDVIDKRCPQSQAACLNGEASAQAQGRRLSMSRARWL